MKIFDAIFRKQTVSYDDKFTVSQYYFTEPSDDMKAELYEGALDKLDMAFKERIKRLGSVAKGMPESIEILTAAGKEDVSGRAVLKKMEFAEKWDDMEQSFNDAMDGRGDLSCRDKFIEAMGQSIKLDGEDYINAVKGLREGDSKIGVSWMQGIVDEVCERIWSLLPVIDIR